MELKKYNLSLIVASFGAVFMTGCTPSTNESTLMPPQENVIIEKKQAVKYVYNASDVEYVDIESMRKMKKATTLLIDKVNSFEQKLLNDSNRLTIIETQQSGNNNKIKNIFENQSNKQQNVSDVNTEDKKTFQINEVRMPKKELSVDEVMQRVKDEKKLQKKIYQAVESLRKKQSEITTSDIIKEAGIARYDAYSQRGYINKLIDTNKKNTIEKRLSAVEKLAKNNQNNIAHLKTIDCCKDETTKNEQNSKYDKKIIEFLDKENLK